MAVLPDFLEEAPPFADEDLDSLFAWSDDGFQPEIPEPHPAQSPYRWSITDMPSAEWAIRKYAALDSEIAEAEQLAADWIEQVRQWLDRTKRPLVRRRGFFEEHLTGYALRRRHEDPRFKTLKLPSGDVPTRLQPARVAVRDDKASVETFVEWALEHAPDTVKAKWSPVADEVKKTVYFLPVWVENGVTPTDAVQMDRGGPWIALPMSGRVLDLIADGDFGEVHEEELALFDGAGAALDLVPGVEQVPETISATVKPAGRK